MKVVDTIWDGFFRNVDPSAYLNKTKKVVFSGGRSILLK